MTLVAQAERETISKRTKEALAVARSHGVKLGNPNGAAALRRAGKGGAPLQGGHCAECRPDAQDLAPVIDDIRPGATSLRTIAAELNARGMLTRCGRPGSLDGDEPAGSDGAAGGGMRRARLAALVEAVASVANRQRALGTSSSAAQNAALCVKRCACELYIIIYHPLVWLRPRGGMTAQSPQKFGLLSFPGP